MLLLFCMQISINVKARPEKSAKETGVVSFLKEVLGKKRHKVDKKDTSLVRKGTSKAKKSRLRKMEFSHGQKKKNNLSEANTIKGQKNHSAAVEH